MKIIYIISSIFFLILTGCYSTYKVSDFSSRDKFYEDFKDEKLKGPLEEFVKLAFRTGYMKGHQIGFSKRTIEIELDESIKEIISK